MKSGYSTAGAGARNIWYASWERVVDDDDDGGDDVVVDDVDVDDDGGDETLSRSITGCVSSSSSADIVMASNSVKFDWAIWLEDLTGECVRASPVSTTSSPTSRETLQNASG